MACDLVDLFWKFSNGSKIPEDVEAALITFFVLSTNAQIKSKHMAGLRLLSFLSAGSRTVDYYIMRGRSTGSTGSFELATHET